MTAGRRGNSRLTEKVVAAMRQEARAGMTIGEMAVMAGVSYASVWRAIHGRTWKNVAEPPLATHEVPPRVANRSLGQAEVLEALRMREDGDTYSCIADRFGVGLNTIWRICRGKTYRRWSGL